MARIEAGLPICGHKDCEIPLEAGSGSAGPTSAGRITEEDVAAVIQRAEDEVLVMLQANWPVVQRVVRMLYGRDRTPSIELDALIRGPEGTWLARLTARLRPALSESAGKRRRRPKPRSSRTIASNDGVSMPEPALAGDAA